MRYLTRFLPALAALAAVQLSGCGGAPSSAADATPNYQTVAMDMDSSDAQSQPLDLQSCHPHLFQRTRDVVRMINHHLFKVMGRVDAIIDSHPLASGNVHTWERVYAGLDIQATLTKNADGSYTFVVEAKPQGAADSAFVQIANASYVAASDGTPHAGTGSITFDLSALASVVPGEKSRGQVIVHFAVSGATKTVQVQLQNFTPDNSSDVIPPKNANYVFQRTSGVGGSLKFEENLVLFCPANPQHLAATLDTVTRWANVNGQIVGRSDSLATGGQIAAGDQWLGLTCFSYAAGHPDLGTEGYWQMKSEDSSGTVLQGDATMRARANASASPSCNAVFGAVPSFDTNQNDYDFASVNFEDASVVPYPGEPSGS